MKEGLEITLMLEWLIGNRGTYIDAGPLMLTIN